MVRLQELYDQILADYVEELIAASQLGCKESGTSFSRRPNDRGLVGIITVSGIRSLVKLATCQNGWFSRAACVMTRASSAWYTRFVSSKCE